MSFVYIGSNVNGGASPTITYAASAGNLLVCSIYTSVGGGAPTVSAVKDNNNNAFTQAVATYSFAGGSTFASVFYLPVAFSGTTSLTATIAQGPGIQFLQVIEYSGVAGSLIAVSPPNNQTTPGTGTNAVTSGTATNITGVPALILGIIGDNQGGNPFTQGTGFTSRLSSSAVAGDILFEDLRATVVGNQQITATSSSSSNSTSTILLAFAETTGSYNLVPGPGSDTFTGNAPTLTPAQNTVVTPFVARRGGVLEPDRRIIVPQPRIFLPTWRRAA